MPLAYQKTKNTINANSFNVLILALRLKQRGGEGWKENTQRDSKLS